MITDGKYYGEITGSLKGKEKYSEELRERIEEAGRLCMESLEKGDYAPIMLLGNIQSGKTRAMIGLMALCFDNDIDMTIILTKCSTALVQQTVKRMTKEFDVFKSEHASVGEVVAQDILDLSFSQTSTVEQKTALATKFARQYSGKKRILVVKKQQDNVERLDYLIEALIGKGKYRNILVVDDEADTTGIGFERYSKERDISLRRVSGIINTVRSKLKTSVKHVLMQVTATPYALYLQPENFMNGSIMPIKPRKTVVLPVGKGYIGGQYYFIDSEDVSAPDHPKAKYLPVIVPQDEVDLINGSKKNKSKGRSIHDGRTLKLDNIIKGQSEKDTFVLPTFRKWFFDVIVGTAILQLNEQYKDKYVSAVLHAATVKSIHQQEIHILERILEQIRELLEIDERDPDVMYFIGQSYNSMKESCKAYGVLSVPSLRAVEKYIGCREDGSIEGLIERIDIKTINSDNDIARLLDDDGELCLQNSLTFFVGGQVLDRGITIKNMIGFFYGRDPKIMQQDTVMQHCRMFGYRTPDILSVTRFYTSARLFENMKIITERDKILRERMSAQSSGEVIYVEAGGSIRATSPQKILASNIRSVLPEKRYLPIGFRIDKSAAAKNNKSIDAKLQSIGAFSINNSYRKGDPVEGKYITESFDCAMELIRVCYDSMIPLNDGTDNKFEDVESMLLFSLSENMKNGNDRVAVITRRGRDASPYKRNGLMYTDAPDDGNNEGALAKELRKNIPVLVLIEETNREWGSVFWWPVFYTPETMNVGIYSVSDSKSIVQEHFSSYLKNPIHFSDFEVYDSAGLDEGSLNSIKSEIGRIQKFYAGKFALESDGTEAERKALTCPIYIDYNSANVPEQEYEKNIKKLILQVKKTIALLDISENDKDRIFGYFTKNLYERNVNDEIREAIIQLIEKKVKSDTHKVTLLGLIEEGDNLLCEELETFGLFLTLGSEKCEIHIFYDAIQDYVRKNNVPEKDMTDFIKYIISHEMFHAIHYADTLTQSGKWIYKRKDFFRQKVVQESMAEYFALVYAKENLGAKCEEIIRTMRDVELYPKDGGYSACIHLENAGGAGQAGNTNTLYRRMYGTSLEDMPKAYEYLTDYLEKNK